ncbi:MAG TPA: lactate racemase domain-containing protein [Propionibacteriaceae bacterium]|jgi:lactate racemase|nr:lactate racemase domain-containing protein [Propionibacteriaceae bacterium]
MGRPGFVLEVDERTPPLLVPDGDRFRLEKFPLGTRVIYPAESLTPVRGLGEAINAALDAPSQSEPLSALLEPAMRLTIAFDDIGTPTPTMRRPDIRGKVIEAVLTRAAAAGVDDVALVSANGLNRRMTAEELQHIVGERVFRSFYADGLLTNHDAENAENLAKVGSTGTGEIAMNARAADSDLLIFVHLVVSPPAGGSAAIAAGLGSTATIGQLSGLRGRGSDAAAEIADLVSSAVRVFQIDVVLDNDVFASPLEFLGHREWEWSLRDRATWIGVRRGLEWVPQRARRRLMNRAEGDYHATLVSAGAPAAVQEASRAQITAQQLVEVSAPADVGVIGVAAHTPYSVDSVTNPILAAWSGLAGAFGSDTGTAFVRPGGALILYHPLHTEFSPLHHPSYVDFFTDVLTVTTNPEQISADYEEKFANDSWYVHLYRTSQAFHGVHPIYVWYQIAAAQRHCSDVVWVGADRESAARLGCRAASTLADALEMVASTVGRTPSISYLHTPPQVLVDIT